MNRKEYNKKYREENKDKRKEYNKKYREENKDKIKEYNKKWREKNKEEIKEYDKKYREKNKEEIKEYGKKWYEENKDKIKEYNKKWYEENKEEIKEYGKKYREENKDKIKEYGKKWCEENKEEIKEYGKKRYEENKEEIKEWYEENRESYVCKKYKITPKEYQSLMKIENCQICGKEVVSLRKNRRNHIDHCRVTKIVRGILCPNCNTALGGMGDNIDGVKNFAISTVKYLRAAEKYTVKKNDSAKVKKNSTEYQKLMKINNCQICGKEIEGRQRHEDHSHVTGITRGILCPSHNTTLGKMGDNIEGVKKWAIAAIKYLRKSETRRKND